MKTALIAHVPSFVDGGRAELDEEGDSSSFTRLSFEDEVSELCDVLRGFGYAIERPPGTTGADIGNAVVETINRHRAGDSVIVYVLSHGRRDEYTGDHYVLGSDRIPRIESNTTIWLDRFDSAVDGYRPEDRPFTLFLLDLCHAGGATVRKWRPRASAIPGRVFALCAALPDEAAYNARFTRALTMVLRRVRSEPYLAGSGSQPAFISLHTIAHQLGREVNLLAEEDHADPQYVISTPISLADELDPPFFPAPRRTAITAAAAAPPGGRLDVETRGLLAAARGTTDQFGIEPPTKGCFVGRTEQITALSNWLDKDDRSALRVVTGRGGSGKSALLGYLACRAHPELRERTAGIFPGSVPGPLPVAGLAVVDARARTLAELIVSISEQWFGDSEVTAATEVVRRVQADRTPPTLLLDGLDAAVETEAIVDELLWPLISSRPDGTATCRVLVASKRAPAAERLLRRARDTDATIDLDSVPRDLLRADLTEYVWQLLESIDRPGNRRGTPAWPGNARAHFAHAVAETLTGDRVADWGEYLVAELYTRWALRHAEPPRSDTDARDLGRRVSGRRRDVFDLHLTILAAADPWVPPVLTALAWSRGDGMPMPILREVTARCGATAANGALAPSAEQIRAALRQAGRYVAVRWCRGELRYAMVLPDLAKWLRRRARASAVLDGILATVGTLDQTYSWRFAGQYVKEHVIQHARDAGSLQTLFGNPAFLIEMAAAVVTEATADPGLASAPGAAPGVAVARESLAMAPGTEAETHRIAMAVEALRVGSPELAAGFVDLPGDPPVVWRPRWVCGERPLAATRSANTSAAGRTAIFVGSGPAVLGFDARTGGDLSLPPMRHETGRIRAIAIAPTPTGPSVVTGGDDGTVRIWPLDGHATAVLLTEPGAPVRSLSIYSRPGMTIVVSAAIDGMLRCHHLDGRRYARPVDCGTPLRQVLVGSDEDRLFALTIGESGVPALWDLSTGRRTAPELSRGDPVACAAIVPGFDRMAALASGNGHVRLVDLPRGVATDSFRLPSSTQAIAAELVDERVVCVAVDGRRLFRWHPLDASARPGELARLADRVEAVAIVSLNGQPAVVTAGGDGTITVLDWNTGAVLASRTVQPAVMALTGGPVAGPMDVAEPGGMFTATGDDGALLIGIAGSCSTDLHAARLVRHGGCGADRYWSTGVGPPATRSLHWLDTGFRPLLCRTDVAGGIQYWDVASGKRITGPSSATSMPDGGVPARRRPNTRSVLTVAGERVVGVRAHPQGGLLIQSGDEPAPTRLAGYDVSVTAVGVFDGIERSLVVTGGRDATLRVWDLGTLTETSRLHLPAPVDELQIVTERPNLAWVTVRAGTEVLVFELALNELGVTR